MSWLKKLFGGKKEEDVQADVQTMPTEEVSMPENSSEGMSEPVAENPVSEPQPTETVEKEESEPAEGGLNEVPEGRVESEEEKLER